VKKNVECLQEGGLGTPTSKPARNRVKAEGKRAKSRRDSPISDQGVRFRSKMVVEQSVDLGGPVSATKSTHRVQVRQRSCLPSSKKREGHRGGCRMPGGGASWGPNVGGHRSRRPRGKGRSNQTVSWKEAGKKSRTITGDQHVRKAGNRPDAEKMKRRCLGTEQVTQSGEEKKGTVKDQKTTVRPI